MRTRCIRCKTKLVKGYNCNFNVLHILEDDLVCPNTFTINDEIRTHYITTTNVERVYFDSFYITKFKDACYLYLGDNTITIIPKDIFDNIKTSKDPMKIVEMINVFS